jgi:hypothetical protein
MLETVRSTPTSREAVRSAARLPVAWRTPGPQDREAAIDTGLATAEYSLPEAIVLEAADGQSADRSLGPGWMRQAHRAWGSSG